VRSLSAPEQSRGARGGEGAEDPGQHVAVQSNPIDGQIGDVGEDVAVEGVAMKCEKHEVVPPLVVGRRRFQNDRDHQSYVLEAGGLRMHVCGEGGVGVGAGVDGAIVVVNLGDHDPLGSGELLFYVMGDGLLLPSEGGVALTCSSLVQGLTCGSHDSNESLLLSVRGSGGGLSRGGGVVLPLDGGGGGMLSVDGGEVGVAARHGRQDVGG
jgi:hypothetical protein